MPSCAGRTANRGCIPNPRESNGSPTRKARANSQQHGTLICTDRQRFVSTSRGSVMSERGSRAAAREPRGVRARSSAEAGGGRLILTDAQLLSRSSRRGLTIVPQADDADGMTFPTEVDLPDVFGVHTRWQHEAPEQLRGHQQSRETIT